MSSNWVCILCLASWLLLTNTKRESKVHIVYLPVLRDEHIMRKFYNQYVKISGVASPEFSDLKLDSSSFKYKLGAIIAQFLVAHYNQHELEP